MEDFTTRTYGTRGLDNRPLFGETSPRDRIINFAVGIVASLLLIVTLISAFVFPHLPPKPVNIFFAFCISLSCVSAGILAHFEECGHYPIACTSLINIITQGNDTSEQMPTRIVIMKIRPTLLGIFDSTLLHIPLEASPEFSSHHQLAQVPHSLGQSSWRTSTLEISEMIKGSSNATMASVSSYVLFPLLFCLQIYWYRQGDLEPKFRNLIYYILFSIIMLCICANLYFHEVGK